MRKAEILAGLGATKPTTKYFFGDGPHIRRLLANSNGRPKTSMQWITSYKKGWDANILWLCFCRAYSHDNLLNHGIQVDELITSYEAYSYIGDKNDQLTIDQAFQVFMKIKDGSIRRSNCSDCRHDFIIHSKRRGVTCQSSKLVKANNRLLPPQTS